MAPASKSQSAREPCASRHALAIALWEKNRIGWLEGDFLGLASRKPHLQEMIGDGGTLWIVVSRRQSHGPRKYSLSFRLDGCRKKTYDRDGAFGRYAVLGHPDRSTVFASNDAKHLLLGMRFDPLRPIDADPKKVSTDRLLGLGGYIQTPRCLNDADVKLLEDFGAEADRWSVFVSYRHEDERTAAWLSDGLDRQGISVFRDKEVLRAGAKWWPALKGAIARARHLVVLIGSKTGDSTWVKKEVEHASGKGVNIIPVLLSAELPDWEPLRERHALRLEPGGRAALLKDLAAATRWRD